MNACEVCGDTPVCKTGLCPACTVDLWAGQTELENRDPCIPYLNEETRHHRAFIKSVNRDSATFLGVYVAEFILSKVFKNVKRMPPCNPGYDFICNKGMKIDVKSSCLSKMNNWQFTTNNNTTADYFLCIAFDNRKDLNPLHLWLIPMEYMHNLSKISVSPNTVSKLDAYKLDINKTITCCDAMKS